MASTDALEALFKNAGSNTAGIKELTKSLKQLDVAKKVFMSAGDPKGLLAVKNMTKAISELITSTEEYVKVSKLIKKAKEENRELDAEEIKVIAKVTEAHENYGKTVVSTQANVESACKKREGYNAQYEADALKNFRTNTLLGKSYSLLASSIGGIVAKIGFTGLAMKAMTRHMQAAEIQQTILIQNYRGLSKGTNAWGTSVKTIAENNIPVVGKSIGKFVGDASGFTSAAMDMSEALAKTQATAQRMGVSTEYVGEAFTKFSRIAGTDSPEVLKTLSEGAITVSRSLGITVPEAIDFVSTRMDKFGGSAAGAIASLNDMRVEAENINKSFGRTVIRGDDVARTVQDISKQTTIYSIDQRFVGNILRENIARLQSTGKSYEQASKQAQVFAEAATGKAPQWMKVFAAQDLYKDMMANSKPEDFVAKFGADLEAAKPGLTAEIQKILKSKDMAAYDKMMLIQEKVSGTTVGIDAMSKQILKLASHPHGAILLAQQFGVTLTEAEGMIDQAKMMENRTNILNQLTEKGVDLSKEEFTLNDKKYKLTTEQAEEMKKIDASGGTELERLSAKKEILNSIIDQKNEEFSMEQDLARLKNEEVLNLKQMDKINKNIAMLQERKLEVQKKLAITAAGSPERQELEKDMQRIDKLIKEKQLEKTRFESKTAEAKGGTKGLKTVEDINKALLEEFKGYSINSGGYFKSILTEMSDTKTLLLAAVTVGIGKHLLKHTGLFKRMEKILANTAAASGAEKLEEEATQKTKGAKGAQQFGPKQTIGQRLKKWGTTMKEGKYDAIVQEHALALAAGASLMSSAMDRLTTNFDKDGNEIQTANSKAAKMLKSFSAEVAITGGALSNLPGALGKAGGALGAVASAWEIGVTVGQGLNTMFDKMGLTGDTTTEALVDFSNYMTGIGKKLWHFFGGKESQGEKVDDKLLATVMKKGFSEQEAKTVIEESKKQNMDIRNYLIKIGKVPANVAGLKPVAGPAGTVAAKPKTTTALTGAAMPANMGTDLATAQAMTATAAAATAAAAATPAATPAAVAATTPAVGGTEPKTMAGTFVGGPNTDGSIMLRVENFLGILAQSNTMLKQKTNRPSA